MFKFIILNIKLIVEREKTNCQQPLQPDEKSKVKCSYQLHVHQISTYNNNNQALVLKFGVSYGSLAD